MSVQRLQELRLAFLVLSRLPVGNIAGPLPSIGQSSWAFPLVGLAVGGLTAAVFAGAHGLGLAPGLAVGLALASGMLATGALHEDGLADVADGFGGGRDRLRKLEIMRDSRLGSYGVLALVLAVGLRWTAQAQVATVDPHRATAAMVAIAVASRAGLAAVVRLMPAARAEGMGQAASAGSATGGIVSAAIGVAALVLLAGPKSAAQIALLIALVLFGFARLALRQIGGQTGDVLGAMQQLADLAAWLFVSAVATGG